MHVTSYHVEYGVNFEIVSCVDDGSEFPQDWERSLCTVCKDFDAGRGKMSWCEFREILLGHNVNAGACVDHHWYVVTGNVDRSARQIQFIHCVDSRVKDVFSLVRITRFGF